MYVINNTTKDIEIYMVDTVIYGCAYSVIIEDIQIIFNTIQEAKEYAKQFVYYKIEQTELFLTDIAGDVQSQ